MGFEPFIHGLFAGINHSRSDFDLLRGVWWPPHRGVDFDFIKQNVHSSKLRHYSEF
jgi:hypothetical protein